MTSPCTVPRTTGRVATGVLLAALLAGCASGTAAPAAPAAIESTPPTDVTTSRSAPPVTPTQDATRRLTVNWVGGKVTGDTGKVPVPLGAPVEIVVNSDTADELHLHGYDLSAKLPAGGSGRLTFTATIAGVFELELHSNGKQLVRLQVG